MRLSALALGLALTLSLPAGATSHLEKAYNTGEPIMKPMVLSRLIEFTQARKVPDLSFNNEAGEPVSLTQYQGDVVLLNLWATWCGPCRKELPEMEALRQHFSGKGLTVVPLNIDQEGELPADVRALLTKLDLPELSTLYDPEHTIGNTVPVNVVPATYLFDGEGNLVGFVRGYLDWEAKGVIPYLEKFVDKYQKPQKS
ncbi:TlpA family protein disulfide reductase [Ferrimonas balearica]|uniref:TlpA family protein disulfide reductase n=1 Tax=Ferrimonas balearica TaxID=44012 RepID=UPI001C56896D|nr:TlpA disulfide reductase family protein [Ferrimonas balearica]MBW3138760.1 TlpA family protein disulfide reductase [Ferrimonas balearica]MBY6105823.1 TlpA family protein disulfide reductase [Ferrimonas balearica]